MAFSGGGSNILKPHKHNSLVLQDGGNLDFLNNTQSDMSAGSTTYSNGSHLQELVKPITPAGEVLTFVAAATAPSWEAGAVNQDRLEQLAFYETTGNDDEIVLTFSSINLDDYACLYLEFSGTVVAALNIQVKMGDGASYRYTYDQSATGTFTNVQQAGQTEWELANSSIITPAASLFVGHMWLYAMQQNEGGDQYTAQWNVGSYTGNSSGNGFTNSGSFDITTVTIQTSTSYFHIHSRFNLMGLRRSA